MYMYIQMIAAVGIIAAESFPFPNAYVPAGIPAIFHFDEMEKVFPNFWLIPTGITAFFEAYSIAYAWVCYSTLVFRLISLIVLYSYCYFSYHQCCYGYCYNYHYRACSYISNY